MKITMRSFLTDKRFFLKYFSLQMIATIVLALAVYHLKGLSLDYTFSWSWLYFLPFTFIIGVQIPVILHNAVHYNIPNKTLNEIIGELCGFFVLFGMGPFRISHSLHHAYPDDPKKDPHPPMDKGFLHFLATTQLNTIKVISNVYFDKFGRNLSTRSIMITQMICYYIGLGGRVFIWFSLLGPSNFVHFYLPAYLVNLVVFAHINYATHQPDGNGGHEIINLDSNLYYKTLNIISSGAYYHQNHHDFPKRYNPMVANNEQKAPLLSQFYLLIRSLY